jgi:hypothetical protein
VTGKGDNQEREMCEGEGRRYTKREGYKEKWREKVKRGRQ